MACKYYKLKRQVSYNNGVTWDDVTPYEYMKGDLYEWDSQDCEPIYREVSGTPYCVGYDKYQDIQYQESSDGGQSWTTTSQTSVLIEADSEDCGYIAPQYRTLTTATTCVGYDKYTLAEYQVSYDGGSTWQTTGSSATTLIEADSEDCGYIAPQYRQTSGTSYCVNYDKYVDVYSQVSYDGGSTWQTTATTSVLIEADSVDCGYIPPTPTGYSEQYFTIEALNNCQIIFNGDSNSSKLSYSTDNGTTWSSPSSSWTQNALILSAGDKALVKGTNNVSLGYFTSNGRFNVYGNIMSLLYGDNFIGQTSLKSIMDVFEKLFNGCVNLVDASNLILPATRLTMSCYSKLFQGCTSLVNAPQLPATTLATNCYEYMFEGCSSLIAAPALPATMLTGGCYYRMFKGCASLTTAPQLPALYLAELCYYYMFSGCASLVNAPQLPVTTLKRGCYHGMFQGCTSLVNAPSLPATTLETSCYESMFANCTSLVNAPSLPATTLGNSCYWSMFQGCSLLNSVTMLATDVSASNCLTTWLRGVSSTGTFTKNANATLPSGESGIPVGWNVINA